MKIICPECQFARDVADDKIPSKSVMATCPKCHTKFRFRPLEFTLEEDVEETAPETAAHQPESTAAHTEASQTGAASTPHETPAQDVTPRTPRPEDGMPEDGATQAAPAAPASDDAAPTVAPTTAPEEADRAGMHAPGHAHMPGQPQRRPDAPDDIWSKLEDMAPEDERRPGDMPPPRDTHDAERPRIDVPFEHLEEHGFFNGLSETIKRICLSPRLFFATMPLDTGKKRPFAFYMLTGMLSAYFQTAWQTMGLDLTTYIFPQSNNVESASTAATLAALVMVLPILLAVGIMVTSGITHLALMPFKAAKNGFTTTFRVCSYASAPTLLAAVPLIGPLAGSFWYLGLIIIGLKHAHETSYTRVTIALGIPFILFTAFVTAVLLAAGPGQQPVF